jgi:hypothetical protein
MTLTNLPSLYRLVTVFANLIFNVDQIGFIVLEWARCIDGCIKRHTTLSAFHTEREMAHIA